MNFFHLVSKSREFFADYGTYFNQKENDQNTVKKSFKMSLILPNAAVQMTARKLAEKRSFW